jgi:hypothetical protein
MYAVYVGVTLVTIAINAWAALADFVRAEFVLANSAALGIPPSWLPLLGAAKGAGAVGLLLGLLGVRLVGIAAAVGLGLFFVGALVAHVRASAYRKIAFPAGYLVLVAASLVLAVVQ